MAQPLPVIVRMNRDDETTAVDPAVTMAPGLSRGADLLLGSSTLVGYRRFLEPRWVDVEQVTTIKIRKMMDFGGSTPTAFSGCRNYAIHSQPSSAEWATLLV